MAAVYVLRSGVDPVPILANESKGAPHYSSCTTKACHRFVSLARTRLMHNSVDRLCHYQRVLAKCFPSCSAFHSFTIFPVHQPAQSTDYRHLLDFETCVTSTFVQ